MLEQYPLQFNKKKEGMAIDARVQMGLPLDSPYVCLHVRDGGFYSEVGSLGKFRCADIADCEQAVDLMISRGLWVVRMGDPGMKPAPFKRSKFIDYPFSKYRSDLLDLYLIKNCQLFVGTDSGPCGVAILFHKDMILLNLTAWFSAFPAGREDLGLIKYFYSKPKQRFLSIKEILQDPYLMNFHYHCPPSEDESDYVIIDNTPEDIRAVVEEKLNQGMDPVYSELQSEFVREKTAQCVRFIDTDPFFVNDPDQSYRFAARMGFKGTLGREFLDKNWDQSDDLAKMTERFRKTGKIGR